MVCATERLTLRELETRDAPFVHALMNEPSFIANIGDRGVRTEDDARRYIETGPWTRYAALGFGNWLVELRGTAEPIGICGLVKRETLPSPDLGFAFLSQYRSKGYALESARAVMDVAMKALQLPRIFAIVRASNIPSIRLLEKLGFDRAEWPDGQNDLWLFVHK